MMFMLNILFHGRWKELVCVGRRAVNVSQANEGAGRATKVRDKRGQGERTGGNIFLMFFQFCFFFNLFSELVFRNKWPNRYKIVLETNFCFQEQKIVLKTAGQTGP